MQRQSQHAQISVKTLKKSALRGLGRSALATALVLTTHACKTSATNDGTTEAVTDSRKVCGDFLGLRCEQISNIAFAVKIDNGYCFYGRLRGADTKPFQIPESFPVADGSATRPVVPVSRNALNSMDKRIWRNYPNGRPGSNDESWWRLGDFKPYLLKEANAADRTPGWANLKDREPFARGWLDTQGDYIVATRTVLENMAYFLEIPSDVKPCPAPEKLILWGK